MRSIRQRLLLWLLVGLALVLAVSGYATYRQARAEINALFDYQLKQTALALRNQNLLTLAMSADPGEGESDAVSETRGRAACQESAGWLVTGSAFFATITFSPAALLETFRRVSERPFAPPDSSSGFERSRSDLILKTTTTSTIPAVRINATIPRFMGPNQPPESGKRKSDSAPGKWC